MRPRLTTRDSTLRRKKLRRLQGPKSQRCEATRTLSQMRRGYRCKKSRRDCSKRKRPHNPTQFSLKPKGMRRGGTRGFNSSNIHSGVTVDTSLGKGCRLYQCWIRLETERCSSYKSFHSVKDDNLRPWISSTETEDACKDICLAKSFAPGAPGSGKERTWTRSWQGIRG